MLLIWAAFPKTIATTQLASWLAMGYCIATNKEANLVRNYGFQKWIGIGTASGNQYQSSPRGHCNKH